MCKLTFMVNKWFVKKFALSIKQKIMGRTDIQIIKKDVKFVRFSSNGKERGVLVADTC